MAWASEAKKVTVISDDYRPSYTAVAGIFQSYLREVSHAALSRMDRAQQEATVLKAKKQLEKELDQVGLAKHIAFDH